MCDACNEQFYVDIFGETGAPLMAQHLQPDTQEDEQGQAHHSEVTASCTADESPF